MSNIFIWGRKNLYPTTGQGIISIAIVSLVGLVLWNFLPWSIFNAVWVADNSDVCRQAGGACWAFIWEKLYFILFGFYPAEERWRAWLVLALFLGGILYSGRSKSWTLSLIVVWLGLVVSMMLLLNGTLLGLPTVETSYWGGLVLTIILAMTGIIFSYPFGVLLALGRANQRLPVIRGICVSIIEIIRGVPFISLLFMASLMLPLFLPSGFVIPKLVRAIVAVIIFSGCYLAETVRGGLAAVSRGQYEAAQSLGLSYWKTMGLVILPQALSKVIQPTVGSFISLFIDTTLVVIISMYDLLGAARAAASDSAWLGFAREAYVFLALIYFAFCYTLSKYSRRLEKDILTKKVH
ncbi:MAG: amino acid ABC transporter permease [SAR324 cluster bacterium]|nr:amino acid ABC transporter permease [SAR324 cluster bacterium]